MEQQVVGVLLGVGSLAVGYLFSKLAAWNSQEAEHLKNVPRYYKFSELERDLSNYSSGVQSNILVEGVVRKVGSSLFSDAAGVDGAGKLVLTTDVRKVFNEETGKWEDRSDTLTNQRLSVPFKLVDRVGGAITVENVHQASGFRSVLQLVHQSKSSPEQRTVGDYATNVTVNEIPTGSKVMEYMLLYGSPFAGLGDAMQVGTGNHSRIIFYPQEVGRSISSLISKRELFAQINSTIGAVLMIGGAALIVFAIIPLIQRHRRQQQDIH